MDEFIEDVENSLECAICFKRLQQPKSLSCLHTFCLCCLQNWVEKQGRLECPTCRQSQTIPEGGLQKLVPNIFVNNMLECLEKVENAGKSTCCCCQNETSFYCQQCRISLCSICIQQHKILPTLVSHTLHPIEDIKTMTLQQFSSLHPALCPAHNEPLKYYCTKCETAICIHCTIVKHKNTDGSHHYIDVSDAFDIFKQKAADIEPAVEDFKTKIEMGHTSIQLRLANLIKNKETCEKEIDGLVEKAIEAAREHGTALKGDVDCIFQQKKQTLETQGKELVTILKKVRRERNFISQLMKSDEATAVGSCDKAIATLKERIQSMPGLEPRADDEIHFSTDRKHIVGERENGIGVIKKNDTALRMEDSFQIVSDDPVVVTQGQIFEVKIIQKQSYEMDSKPLKATLKHSTGAIIPMAIMKQGYRSYSVTCYSNNTGMAHVSVCVQGKEIQGSPVQIKVVRLEDIFEIASGDPVVVTQGQKFEVKIKQKQSYEMDSKPLKATLSHSTEVIIHMKVKKQSYHSYSVTCYSTTTGMAHVSVRVQGKEIQGSPLQIKVVSEGLSRVYPDIKPYVRSHKTMVRDIVIGDYVLVAGCSNEVLRFHVCGNYVDRIGLPKGTKVNRMYKLKQSDGLLISDGGKTRILVYSKSNVNDILQWNGLREPYGLTMDESKQSRQIYVADRKAHCIFIYHMGNRQLVKKVGSQGNHSLYQMEGPYDVTITKNRNILVADYGNNRLLLLTADGLPLRYLLKGNVCHPCAVITDRDGNIIIANKSELKVYDSEGNFIKIIGGSHDEVKELEGLAIWSYCPRSVAVADFGSNEIKIFNY